MNRNEKIGNVLIIIGYVVLFSWLFILFLDLEYKLALDNVSILHFNFEKIPEMLFTPLISIPIILMLVGWLIQYDQRYTKLFKVIKSILINRIWNYKKSFLFNLLFFVIFLIEVMLSVLLVYLIILWAHLKESVNIPYLISLILSATAIKFLERKMHKWYK